MKATHVWVPAYSPGKEQNLLLYRLITNPAVYTKSLGMEAPIDPSPNLMFIQRPLALVFISSKLCSKWLKTESQTGGFVFLALVSSTLGQKGNYCSREHEKAPTSDLI